MPTDVAATRAAFRELHRSGCFLLPNPWDAGGVRRLERRGFRAIASSSAACAWSLGREDMEITLEESLAHMAMLSDATELPVNADFENGFADDPDAVGTNVTRALRTGIARLSIEDRRRGGDQYPADMAARRIAAARLAIDRAQAGVVLVARCETYLVRGPDLDDVIARARAFAEAGADCMYAPGLIETAEIRALVDAVAPLAVNVLLLPDSGMTPAAVASAGARRISLGSLLARAAWDAFDAAVSSIAEPP